MTGSRRLRVAVLFDTAGFLRSLPLTGAAARTFHLNLHLATGADVTLLLCDLNPLSQPTDAWPFPLTYLSPETMYRDTARLTALVARNRPDVLIMSNTNLLVHHGRALADAVGCALLYEMLDDEAALLRSVGASAGESHDAGRLQNTAIALADGVVTLTNADAATARRATPRPVYVVPCGAEPGPPPSFGSGCDTAVFLGNVHYEPNLRAVHYLRHTLAPALRRAGHRTTVDVVGRYPPEARTLAQPDLLRLHGPVPDLAGALAGAVVGLAPLDSGGGMKLKVLRYMAAGLPVVGTPGAFGGFDSPHDFALVSATDLGDFPDHVAHLLADPDLRQALGSRGRDIAASRFSWCAIAQVAARAYTDIARRTGETVPCVLPPDVAVLAARPPYWLHEWRSRERDTASVTPALASGPASGGPPHSDDMPEDLAAALACARAGAEAALATSFAHPPRIGYGHRSVVILGDNTVLKVYTHRGTERMEREQLGLKAAAGTAGFDVPRVLGHADPPGGLPWLAFTRLPGTVADALPPDPAVDAQIGRLAARLHTVGPSCVATLPTFRRYARPPDKARRPPARTLAAALAAISPAADCGSGFVHGDFSRRNVLVDSGDARGLIDFERCGVGCPHEDLATFQLHNVLLGSSDGDAMVTAYADELAELRQGRADVSAPHLAWHVARYAAWVLQWAFDVDPPLADQVSTLVPRLVADLPGPRAPDQAP